MRSFVFFLLAAVMSFWAATAAAEPRIAIVVDDVGVHVPNGWRVVELPGPLTLALMTYAKDLEKLAAQSKARGHELLLHIPMEPTDTTWDTGPNALTLDLTPEEFQRRLDWAFGRFDGYVGISNHMGSRFTEDSVAMARFMAELAPKGLFFLDSLTGLPVNGRGNRQRGRGRVFGPGRFLGQCRRPRSGVEPPGGIRAHRACQRVRHRRCPPEGRHHSGSS